MISRRGVALATLAALAFLACAPQGAAHVDTYSQSTSLATGPFLVFFEPRPTPPFAGPNNPVSLVAQVADNATGTLLRDVPGTVLVGGPEEFVERKKMDADGTGYLVASMVLPARGTYSARLILFDAKSGQNFSADTEFEVFPDIAYRIRPVDQAVDVYTGSRTPLAFEVVDPRTLAPKDTLTDLTINVEHWSEDHTTFLGAEPYAATRVTTGVWRIEPTFGLPGMYHMRFASQAGGFNYTDVPLLHVYAIDPATASVDPDKPTPGFALAPLALAVALALALRRKR